MKLLEVIYKHPLVMMGFAIGFLIFNIAVDKFYKDIVPLLALVLYLISVIHKEGKLY